MLERGEREENEQGQLIFSLRPRGKKTFILLLNFLPLLPFLG